MRTVDKKGKKAVSELIKAMFGDEVGDISEADNQCGCLLVAITVWIFIDYVFVLYYYFTVCHWFRMEMRVPYATKLD